MVDVEKVERNVVWMEAELEVIFWRCCSPFAAHDLCWDSRFCLRVLAGSKIRTYTELSLQLFVLLLEVQSHDWLSWLMRRSHLGGWLISSCSIKVSG